MPTPTPAAARTDRGDDRCVRGAGGVELLTMTETPPPLPVVLVLCEPLAGVPALCAMLADLVARTGAELVWCDVGNLRRPGLHAAGVIGRLRVTAGDLGCALQVVRAPRRFVVLVTVLGLGDALPCVGRDIGDPFA
jgi:hypothetical protein